MAKLGSYYGLCPLIDSQSLLGISEDFEKGVVVVTLGKNIASRYKLSDQKQIDSWRTKEKFSSPVIYDKKKSKYVAVFNHSYIKLWSAEEENLDKLKKYKFSQPIYSIISNSQETFVIFQNGTIDTLEEALESRKTLNIEQILSDGEEIKDILSRKYNNQFYIGLIVKSNDYTLYWTQCNGGNNRFFKIKLAREGCNLKGYVFHLIDNSIHLLTLWSDGRILSCPLKRAHLETSTPGELFSVIESVSTKDPVSMLSLDENYIALYGANRNEEGAILIMYNSQFKVTQSKQPFKLYTKDANIWCIDHNLYLPVGQNLAVIPFYLEIEQLAALVGSHKNIQNDADIAIVQEFQLGCWEKKSKAKETAIPKGIEKKIREFVIQGVPESLIVEDVLPDVFKKQDVDLLAIYLDYFYDIPDIYLANILRFLVASDCKVFSNKEQYSSKFLPTRLQPLQRISLIDRIFCRSFSHVTLLPYLRSELEVNDVLLLIEYICFLSSEEGHTLPSLTTVKTDERLFEWGCALVDSNYQKLLFCKDNSVNDVLNRFRALVSEHLQCLEVLRDVTPLLRQVKQQKSLNRNMTLTALKYSIEQMTLY